MSETNRKRTVHSAYGILQNTPAGVYNFTVQSVNSMRKMYLCLQSPHFSLILVILSAGEHSNFSYGHQGDF